MRKWRNGSRAGLRNLCPQGRGGSSPPFRTIWGPIEFKFRTSDQGFLAMKPILKPIRCDVMRPRPFRVLRQSDHHRLGRDGGAPHRGNVLAAIDKPLSRFKLSDTREGT